MAEGFEPYHVPQQSRRDKLRVVDCSAALLPLYDPAGLISSDLLTCTDAGGPHEFHPQNNPIGDPKSNQECVVKEERANLMSYVHNHYLDMNPSSIQADPFVYDSQNHHNIRDFDHAYHGGDVVTFKPEPLSLSLSSTQRSHQNSVPLELNLQSYGSNVYNDKVSGGYVVHSIITGSASTSNDVSVPLGPFTGYASILKGSKFLKPAQQLLEELCDVGREIYVEKAGVSSSLMDASVEGLGGDGLGDDHVGCGDGGRHRRKKSRLLSMLDEVYRRYKQYYQQMQSVVASFECVAGLGNAAPYANLALKTMSKHFRCLKNVITNQLQLANKAQVHTSNGKDEDPRFGNSDMGIFGQRLTNNSGFLEHPPVWRPQRGLPERAVTVLRAWLFEHFLHPYPTDSDKLMLAKKTGLSRSQVSNWFINARVRLWKPMVEEIHTLETRQAQKASHREERNAHRSDDHLPPGSSHAAEFPPTTVQKRNELSDAQGRTNEPHLPFNNFSNHPQVGVGVSMAGGSSNISLTLGLHQNNGIGSSESFSITTAQRFGLRIDADSDGYVLGGFEMQNRHC